MDHTYVSLGDFRPILPTADHPKCEMRASHASAKYKDDAPELPKSVKKEKWTLDSMVKGRNEPATIIHVAHVIAKVKGISTGEVCQAAWNNSVKMFGLGVAQEQQEPLKICSHPDTE